MYTFYTPYLYIFRAVSYMLPVRFLLSFANALFYKPASMVIMHNTPGKSYVRADVRT